MLFRQHLQVISRLQLYQYLWNIYELFAFKVLVIGWNIIGHVMKIVIIWEVPHCQTFWLLSEGHHGKSLYVLTQITVI